MNNNVNSSHQVDLARLYGIVNEIRSTRSVTWVQVTKELGLHKDYFTRLKWGNWNTTMSGDALVSILMWVYRYGNQNVLFEVSKDCRE